MQMMKLVHVITSHVVDKILMGFKVFVAINARFDFIHFFFNIISFLFFMHKLAAYFFKWAGFAILVV